MNCQTVLPSGGEASPAPPALFTNAGDGVGILLRESLHLGVQAGRRDGVLASPIAGIV